jgi:hypothetical protein
MLKRRRLTFSGYLSKVAESYPKSQSPSAARWWYPMTKDICDCAPVALLGCTLIGVVNAHFSTSWYSSGISSRSISPPGPDWRTIHRSSINGSPSMNITEDMSARLRARKPNGFICPDSIPVILFVISSYPLGIGSPGCTNLIW